MTLRGSEQSLLHNPFRVENNGTEQSKSTPLFSRVLYASALCLTLSFSLALSLTMPLMTPAIMSALMPNGNSLPNQTNQAFAGTQEFLTAPNRANQYNHGTDRNTHARHDIIITPFENPIDFKLKQLTATLGRNQSSPYEIPLHQVMTLLAHSNAGNIVVSPDLKFYPTTNRFEIRACPLGVQVFPAAIGGANGCFPINVKPMVKPAVKPPLDPADKPMVKPTVEPMVEPVVEPLVKPANDAAAQTPHYL